MSSATLECPASSRIKFRLAGGAQPLMLLPVCVNGEGPFEFILDTGAGTSLLASELAASLQIRITGSKQGQTAGGPVEVQLATLDELAVGEVRREHFGPASLADVPMRLAHPAKPLILVEAHLAGKGPFQFAVDTGTSTTAISPELAAALGLKSTAIHPVTTGGAPITMTAAQVPAIRIGRAELRDVDVIIGDFLIMLSQVAGCKLDGILGYNFLRNYKVVIDYPNEVFRLD